MVVKGSGGEKYTLNAKNKQAYRAYTDYPVGNGTYIARILDRSHRSSSVEEEIESAVRSGTYYEEEQPLNLLYMGKKFVGFLYAGNGNFFVETEGDLETNSMQAKKSSIKANGGMEQVYVIGAQVAAVLVMAAVGMMAIYPILVKFMEANPDSSIISMLHYLDYKGIPAIVAGIILQCIVFARTKESINHVIYSGLLAMLVNLAGIVLWTLLVLLLMMIVQGAVDFIMRYLLYIILFIGAGIWLKSKIRMR